MKVLTAAAILIRATSLWAQGQMSGMSMMQQSRDMEFSAGEIELSVIPPTPISISPSDFLRLYPSVQISPVTIQAVPEPSILALGSLAVGCMAAFHRKQSK